MEQNRVILCASNAYEQKYFFNNEFDRLPESIQEELKIISVLFTEDVGGLFMIGFYEDDGELFFEVTANEEDLLYDDIGSRLKVKELQSNRKEMWESLENYYKAFYIEVNNND